MLANRILIFLANLLAFVTLPLTPVTTLVGGCLIQVTFGLLLLPLSLIWIVLFLGPLLGLAWFWERAPPLRLLLPLMGIPTALLGGVYVTLIPSMGELESRLEKLRICWTWPFTLEYIRYRRGELSEQWERQNRIEEVLNRVRV